MIRLIQGVDAAAHPAETNAMFRARAATFQDRLGWQVSVKNGLEVDRYDALNPLYLISVDGGTAKGSLRLLPTSGPNMLGECFGSFFDDSVNISSPTIWECTRFCVHPGSNKEEVSPTGAMRTTWELMLGICEVALLAGLTHIQGVYSESMIRVYKRTRWSPTPVAKSKQPGSPVIYVGLWDVNEEVLNRMRRVSGITSSVIEPEETHPLLNVA